MGFLVVFFSGFRELATAYNSCPAFSCQHSTDKCLWLNETQLTYEVSYCDSQQVCDFEWQGTLYYTTTLPSLAAEEIKCTSPETSDASSSSLLPPGRECSDNSECASEICSNRRCQGKQLGEDCNDYNTDMFCDSGLYWNILRKSQVG